MCTLRTQILGILIVFLLAGCGDNPATPTRALRPTSTKIIPTTTITTTPIPTQTPIPQVLSGKVLATGLNIRSGPGTNFGAIGSMKQGDEFYILGDSKNSESQQWLLIPLPDNSFGWVIGEPYYVTQKLVTVDYSTYLMLQDSIQRAKLIQVLTPTVVFVRQPTPKQVPTTVVQSAPSAVCTCSYNAYNCDDFATHNQAQSCFNYCLTTVGYDVHGLDRDNDGSACEANP